MSVTLSPVFHSAAKTYALSVENLFSLKLGLVNEMKRKNQERKHSSFVNQKRDTKTESQSDEASCEFTVHDEFKESRAKHREWTLVAAISSIRCRYPSPRQAGTKLSSPRGTLRLGNCDLASFSVAFGAFA